MFFRNFLIVVFTVFLPLNSAFSFSQVPIENSYIITFKENTGVIDPPDPENRGKVPFGVPTSGQDKDELAAALGLNGEIVAILEANNGIVVEMGAEEAEKWRQDERVLSVDQGISGVFAGPDGSQDPHPVYRDGLLNVPCVLDEPSIVLYWRDKSGVDVSIGR